MLQAVITTVEQISISSNSTKLNLIPPLLRSLIGTGVRYGIDGKFGSESAREQRELDRATIFESKA